MNKSPARLLSGNLEFDTILKVQNYLLCILMLIYDSFAEEGQKDKSKAEGGVDR